MTIPSTPPVRVQLKRTKGWKMPPNTVKVTRPGKWGNPFDFRKSDCCWVALSYGCRGDTLGRQEASVLAFRDWIAPNWGRRTLKHEEQPKMGDGNKFIDLGPKITAGPAPSQDEIITELSGKNLACFCKIGDPCHADVLLELANTPPRIK